MNDERIFKGLWFLPNDIENKINGILTYNPHEEYSELELFGNLNNYDDNKDFELVLGTTLDGEDITLCNCRVVHSRSTRTPSSNSKTVYLSRIKSEFILCGAHITKPEDLVFQKISTEIYNFENWIGIHGFSDDTEDSGNEINFNYQRPKAIDFAINDNTKGEIKFFISTKEPVLNTEYNFKQSTRLSFNSSELVSFRTLLNHVYNFQDFLVLSLFTHTVPFNIVLISDKIFTTHKTGNGELNIPKEIKLLTRQVKKISRAQPKFSFQMLFTYKDIEKEFPIIIRKWYEKYETLKDSFGLFFYQFYINDKYLNVLFLNLAQAAESFHYHLNPKQKLLESKEFKERRDKIESKLSEDIDLFLWIKPYIKNDLYLDIRLSEIIEKYCNDTLLKYIGDVDSFKRDIKNSRNYYTHFNPSLKNKALKGNELLDLYTKLRLLLISAFLIESGFDIVTVSGFFKKNGSQVFSVNLNKFKE
jgi:hypothetical protein